MPHSFINMKDQHTTIHNKSCKTYFLAEGQKVYFSGDFDSGNLEKVQQLSHFTYRITPGYDLPDQTTKKNYFHFQTFGFQQCTVKFQVTRAYLLQTFIKRGSTEVEGYHPVVKKSPESPFEKISSPVEVYYNAYNQPELSFKYEFKSSVRVEFAFTYPYSYTDCQNLIKQMDQQYSLHANIYFHQEILCHTQQGRNVHLITITDMSNCLEQKQPEVEGIFPNNQRPFRINRPKVVISARVHPGESPSSFCLQGIMRFLLNQKDYRSLLLRKYFHFILIPMVNPDGVAEGMFRSDLNGDNLNRCYKYCSPWKHKPIWCITNYIKSLEKVDFFFDLHAHPSLKRFFIYGNSYSDFACQVEAQMFGKLVQHNCPYFQNLDSIFSERAMRSKDKFDCYSKQGCARVHYSKEFKMVHSYTVQCGYFYPTKLNSIHKCVAMQVPKAYECTSDWQDCSLSEYCAQSYMLLGKSLLVSILDLFQINPFSNLLLSDYHCLHTLRKTVAHKLLTEGNKYRQRERITIKFISDISNIIDQQYYQKRVGIQGLKVAQINHQQKAQLISVDKLESKVISREKPEVQVEVVIQKDPIVDEKVISSSEDEDKSQTFHQNLLNSFSRYGRSFKLLTRPSKLKEDESKMKLRRIKTFEGEPVIRKTLKMLRLKSQQDQSPPRNKIESEVMERMLSYKLQGIRGLQQSDRRLQLLPNQMLVRNRSNLKSQTRLPSLGTAKNMVIGSPLRTPNKKFK